MRDTVRNLAAALMASAAFGCPAGGDVLTFGADGVCRTPKFINKGKVGTGRNGVGFGNVWRVDEKFRRAAASATLTVKDNFVTLVCTCPVPAGMKPERCPENIWGGDVVEFFVRPDPSADAYFHYAVNAGGKTWAAKSLAGAEASGWKSGFTGACADTADGFEVTMRIPRAEIFPETLKDGDVFTAQITRNGATSEGISSWRPVGTSFHDVNSFGRIVYGSVAAYFRRRLDALRANQAQRPAAADAKARADAAIAAVGRLLRQKAGAPDGFDALERAFADLDRQLLEIALGGRSLLVYRPDDPWGNVIVPNAGSRPLGKVSLKTSRGMRAYYPFAVANLSDETFVGQVKVFDEGPKKYFCREDTHGVARRFTVHETIPVVNEAGLRLWDATPQLAMNSILRIAPHATALVWLELDARGLEAGRHTAVLYVKRGVPGFDIVTVPVEVDVGAADVAKDNYVGRSGHMYLTIRTDHEGFVDFLVGRDFNCIYLVSPDMRHLQIYPKVEADGTIRPGDMTKLDRIIERHFKRGLDPKDAKLWMFLCFNRGYCPKFGPYGRVGDPGEKWVPVLKAFLDQFYGHLKERWGITADRVYLHPVDEPYGDADDPDSETARCCRFGRIIKSIRPDCRLLVDPLLNVGDAELAKTLSRLAETYDVIELNRPRLTPERLRLAKSLKFREYWTYSIPGKETPPAGYCRDYWENMRDGFSEYAVYWHVDEHNGGDGIDSTDSKDGRQFIDWGTVLADFDSGCIVPTRRQIAADLGYDDVRLIKWCRAKAKGDAALSARIESIVRAAADAGSMSSLERARNELIDLADGLAKDERRGR